MVKYRFSLINTKKAYSYQMCKISGGIYDKNCSLKQRIIKPKKIKPKFINTIKSFAVLILTRINTQSIHNCNDHSQTRQCASLYIKLGNV